MVSGENRIDDPGWRAIEPEEIADAVGFAVNQNPGTTVNNIVIRPSGQIF